MNAERVSGNQADNPSEGRSVSLDSSAGLLSARSVSKSFSGFFAVNDVSLDIEQGNIVGLIGPNGAGKTTLFNVLSRFLPLTSGEVYFDGQRVDRLPPHLLAQRGMVRTFQIARVLSKMSVLENVMLAAPDQSGESIWKTLVAPRSVRQEERAIRKRANELLEYFSLSHLRDDFAGSLSGGQRKLLEMARALMADPRLLLLDEPLAGVNPALAETIVEYILDLNKRGITMLVVEHDIEAIMAISDRLIVMAGGEIIARGTPRAVRSNPDVIEAYLGSAAAETAGGEGQ